MWVHVNKKIEDTKKQKKIINFNILMDKEKKNTSSNI